MIKRFRILAFFVAFIGLGFLAAGGFAFFKAQEGYRSLNAFSAAQDVQLTYNEEGQLVDRGEVEGAQGIMALLTEDWAYPVVDSELDPNDPLVNTASEYMFQMATISYHTLHGTQTVVLTEPVEYNGETFEAGTYEVPVDGRYFSQFDRSHPLEGPARAQAWTGTAFGLIAQLGVGTMTAQALQLALALAAVFAGIGATLIFIGAGVIWATRAEPVEAPVLRTAPVPA